MGLLTQGQSKMGNQAKITLNTSNKDIPCDMLLAAFSSSADFTSPTTLNDVQGENGDYFSVELRIAELVHLEAGITPSYAKINIPMANFGPGKWDENAYAVAFKNGGPAGRLKLKSRCAVYMYTSDKQRVSLLNGTVVSIAHDVKLDGLTVTVWDDKFLLQKVTCFGQAQYNPNVLNNDTSGTGNTSLYGFVSNAKLIFNEFGWPNCLDRVTDGGGTVPVFAPTIRYGWAVDPQKGANENVIEPLPGKATARARSWRVSDAVTYLRMMHYGSRPGGAQNYPGQKIADGLVWPAGIEQLFNNGGLPDRKLNHCNCEGLTLDAALTKIAHRAGPFELYMRPAAGNGGNNGNDVLAGGIALGNVALQSFQSAFDDSISALNTSFNSGYSSFVTAFNQATPNFLSAFQAFQRQTSGPYDDWRLNALNEISTQIRNALANPPASWVISATAFKAGLQEQWKQALAAYGAVVDGNTGRYTLPNGAIAGGADGSVSLGGDGD